jgi:uncharacterized protein YjbJ (UPF0337 family)
VRLEHYIGVSAGTAFSAATLFWHPSTAGEFMDKDRVEGAMKQAGGKVKDALGKLTGDSKMQAEGKADKVEGKVQNTVGGVKDTLRGDK